MTLLESAVARTIAPLQRSSKMLRYVRIFSLCLLAVGLPAFAQDGRDLTEEARKQYNAGLKEAGTLIKERQFSTAEGKLDALIAQPGYDFDQGQAAAYLQLAAWDLGVGSCIASIYPDASKRKARELLGVPEGKWLHTAISLGYPADERALRLSAERGGLSEVPIGRQDLSQFVSWERFAVP